MRCLTTVLASPIQHAGFGITTADNVIVIRTNVAGRNVDHSCSIGEIFGETASNGAAVFIDSDGRLGTVTSSQRIFLPRSFTSPNIHKHDSIPSRWILPPNGAEVTVTLPLQCNAGAKRLSTPTMSVEPARSVWPLTVTVTVLLLSTKSNTHGNVNDAGWDCSSVTRRKKNCIFVAGLSWAPRFRS